MIDKFLSFVQTPEYFYGLIIALTGVAVELIFLLIAIPIILHFTNKVRTKPIRANVDFYLFQFFHKVTRMFLSMASFNDIFDYKSILENEQKKNPDFKIFSHRIYGNLENIIFVLRTIFANGTFAQEVKKRTLGDFQEYATICEKCIDEIDRLAAILVFLPKVQQTLFVFRAVIYPLRDVIYNNIQALKFSAKEKEYFHDYYVLEELAQGIVKFIDKTFQERRKLIDSIMKRRVRMYEARSWFKPLGWAPEYPGYIWFLLKLHLSMAGLWKKRTPSNRKNLK